MTTRPRRPAIFSPDDPNVIVTAAKDDPLIEILREADANAQLPAVADQNAAAAMLGHLLGGGPHRVVGMADQRPVARDDLPYGPRGHGLDLPHADGSFGGAAARPRWRAPAETAWPLQSR